jgi:hypothetical protein
MAGFGCPPRNTLLGCEQDRRTNSFVIENDIDLATVLSQGIHNRSGRGPYVRAKKRLYQLLDNDLSQATRQASAIE